jgi:hypothetical protein
MFCTILATAPSRRAPDVAIDLQLAPLDVVEHVLPPQVPVPRVVVQIGLHQQPLLRHVGKQVRALALVVEQVIELHLHRRVLERERVVHELQVERLRALGQRVGLHRPRPRHQILEERLVVLVGDDRQPFGHGHAQPARVIEVMVADDDVRQRLGLSLRASSMTAFERVSLSGASKSTRWSANSNTMLR